MDKFFDLVNSTAETNLRLCDFHPRTALKSAAHVIERPRFPVIDFHNHVDSMKPEEVLAIMDQSGVEHLVNITMQVGERAHEILDKYHAARRVDFHQLGGWIGRELSAMTLSP